jgi:hypothetical protein
MKFLCLEKEYIFMVYYVDIASSTLALAPVWVSSSTDACMHAAREKCKKKVHISYLMHARGICTRMDLTRCCSAHCTGGKERKGERKASRFGLKLTNLLSLHLKKKSHLELDLYKIVSNIYIFNQIR